MNDDYVTIIRQDNDLHVILLKNFDTLKFVEMNKILIIF